MPESRITKDSESLEATLAHVAMLYYREGLTQGEIAQRVGVSRATIINYLRLARDLGVVDIRIRGESFTTSPLARRLSEQFALADCYIAHDDGQPQDDANMLERVAQLGASAMRDLLEAGDSLGVAWGETIQHVARAFPMGPVPSLTVYQIVGSMVFNPLYAAENCTIEIARKTLAACRTLHTPAVVSSVDLADRLRAEPIIARQIEQLAHLTKAVFAVGSLVPPTTLMAAGLTSSAELKAYVDAGAVGVLWGHFVDERGQVVEGPLSGRVISIAPADLRRVPVRMLVSAGPSKHRPILAALRGGYVSHLVTDEASAVWLLDQS
jgi:deoxyribonucleoside regulator